MIQDTKSLQTDAEVTQRKWVSPKRYKHTNWQQIIAKWLKTVTKCLQKQTTTKSQNYHKDSKLLKRHKMTVRRNKITKSHHQSIENMKNYFKETIIPHKNTKGLQRETKQRQEWLWRDTNWPQRAAKQHKTVTKQRHDENGGGKRKD